MNKDLLIKTLLYRSLHRGCKETDILLGKYAVEKINDFDDDKLDTYSKFVLEDDAYLYDWILDKSTIPSEYKGLIEDIRLFHKL